MHALFGGVRPVFEPHRPLARHGRPAGDVAGGRDTGGGEQRGGAHDAVGQFQPGACQPGGLGHDADRDEHDVGPDERAVVETDGLDVVPADEVRDTDPGPHVDSVVGVDLADYPADERPEHPQERRGLRFDHGHLGTEPAAPSPRPPCRGSPRRRQRAARRDRAAPAGVRRPRAGAA